MRATTTGEIVCLLGPSGCGKTTTLRMIAGFERPTAGEIYIGDQLVSSEKYLVPPERRNLGMVFQNYAVWPHMTVFDNVAYPPKLREKVMKTLGAARLAGCDSYIRHLEGAVKGLALPFPRSRSGGILARIPDQLGGGGRPTVLPHPGGLRLGGKVPLASARDR